MSSRHMYNDKGGHWLLLYFAGNLEDGSTSGVSAAKSDKLACTTVVASPSLENGDVRASEHSKGTGQNIGFSRNRMAL